LLKVLFFYAINTGVLNGRSFPFPRVRRWGGAEAPDWLTLRALFLTAPPDTVAALFPRAAAVVLGPVAADHEGDPALRLSVLGLMDALLEDPVRGAGEVVCPCLELEELVLV
jgi:hypothetical protein